MLSAFTIRNMDSTPEPPSPNMAATDPKQRKLRKCTNCTSRMPSFFYDNHTLCTKCRNQVCNMNLVCDECRDWPITKRKTFVHYNNKLRIKRESKRRQARLASTASDQSVCDRDTDVPLEEPSVPMQNIDLNELDLDQDQNLTSEEVVVSAGISAETDQTNFLVLPPGSDINKLAFTVLSKITDLQSARGPQTPIQSQSMPAGLNQQAIILPNACQPSVQSFSAGSNISQQGIILPNVCQTSVQAESIINQPSVILPSVSQSIFNNNDIGGGGHSAPPPPPLFVNPNQPTFRPPTAPSSTGFQQEATQNPQNPVASAPSPRGFQQEATQNPENPVASNGGSHTLNQALSSIYQTIAGLTASGISPPQSLWDSAASLARRLQDARLAPQQPLPSASAKPRSPQQGPSRPEATLRSPETARRVQQATTRVHEETTRVHEATRRVQETTTRVPELARGIPEATSWVPEATSRGHEATPRGHEATARGRNTTRWSPEMTRRNPGHQESNARTPGRPDLGPSKSRSFESPHRSSDRSSHQGSQTPPRKRRRHSGNSSDEDPAFQNRQHRDDQQEEEDNFRPSSLDLLLNYITSTFPAASQPFIQPSSKRFHIM